MKYEKTIGNAIIEVDAPKTDEPHRARHRHLVKSGYGKKSGEVVQTEEVSGVKIELVSGGMWQAIDHPELGKFVTLQDAERILKDWRIKQNAR